MISPTKARKILHDGKVHGKPLTESQRKFFGARASGYPIMKYASGGRLENIYKTGSAEDLWQAWDVIQRTHFLIDHYDMFSMQLDGDTNKYAQKFSHSAYKDLPKQIQQQVVIHHAMGFYEEGGRINGDIPYYYSFFFNDVLNSIAKKEKISQAKATHYINRKEDDNYLKQEWKKGTKPSVIADFIIEKNKKSMSKNGHVRYLTPNKKQLLSKITSIKEKMQKVKDPQVLDSINAHIQKLEALLHSKPSTREKVDNWKKRKTEKRLNRK